jgi:hypothetical protein
MEREASADSMRGRAVFFSRHSPIPNTNLNDTKLSACRIDQTAVVSTWFRCPIRSGSHIIGRGGRANRAREHLHCDPHPISSYRRFRFALLARAYRHLFRPPYLSPSKYHRPCKRLRSYLSSSFVNAFLGSANRPPRRIITNNAKACFFIFNFPPDFLGQQSRCHPGKIWWAG